MKGGAKAPGGKGLQMKGGAKAPGAKAPAAAAAPAAEAPATPTEAKPVPQAKAGGLASSPARRPRAPARPPRPHRLRLPRRLSRRPSPSSPPSPRPRPHRSRHLLPRLPLPRRPRRSRRSRLRLRRRPSPVHWASRPARRLPAARSSSHVSAPTVRGGGAFVSALPQHHTPFPGVTHGFAAESVCEPGKTGVGPRCAQLRAYPQDRPGTRTDDIRPAASTARCRSGLTHHSTFRGPATRGSRPSTATAVPDRGVAADSAGPIRVGGRVRRSRHSRATPAPGGGNPARGVRRRCPQPPIGGGRPRPGPVEHTTVRHTSDS